jgi:uncharacterized RDD family membrane protein YckC
MVLPGPLVTPASLAPAPAPTAAAPAVAWGGFWRRFWAYWLDSLITWVLGIGLTVVIRASAGVSVWPLWKESAQATPVLNLVEFLMGIVLWFGYCTWYESSPLQATPGKRALRLKVTDLAGRRISVGRAFARRLAMVLSVLTLGIGFAMAGFTRRRQALHDMVAGTLVIHEPR